MAPGENGENMEGKWREMMHKWWWRHQLCWDYLNLTKPSFNGCWFHIQKVWKSIGMMIPNIWENEKCSKPPTSLALVCGRCGWKMLKVECPGVWGDYGSLQIISEINPVNENPEASRSIWNIPAELQVQSSQGFALDFQYVWRCLMW